MCALKHHLIFGIYIGGCERASLSHLWQIESAGPGYGAFGLLMVVVQLAKVVSDFAIGDVVCTNCAIGDLVTANSAIGSIPLFGLTDTKFEVGAGSNEQEGGLPYALSQYLTTHAKKCVLCVMASPRVIDKSEQLLIPTFHRFAFVTTM